MLLLWAGLVESAMTEHAALMLSIFPLQDFQLEAAAVYSKVAKVLVKQQKYSEIRQLLKCVNESGVAAKNDGDIIILNCLDEFKDIPSEVMPPPWHSLLRWDSLERGQSLASQHPYHALRHAVNLFWPLISHVLSPEKSVCICKGKWLFGGV